LQLKDSYVNQGKLLLKEAALIREAVKGKRRKLWNVAMQGAVMTASSTVGLKQIMLNYDREQTLARWNTHYVQSRVGAFHVAINSRERKLRVGESYTRYGRNKSIDPRRIYHRSRDKLCEDLGINRQMALELKLEYTVPRTWARLIKRRSSAGVRNFNTAPGTAENSRLAGIRAQYSTNLYFEGFKIWEIADMVGVSVRSIYRYLRQGLSPRSLKVSNAKVGTIEKERGYKRLVTDSGNLVRIGIKAFTNVANNGNMPYNNST